MPDDRTDSIMRFFRKAKELVLEIFIWRLAVRQKFGATSFNVPVVILLIVTLIAPHLVLIAVLIALIAGYRLSFERRK